MRDDKRYRKDDGDQRHGYAGSGVGRFTCQIGAFWKEADVLPLLNALPDDLECECWSTLSLHSQG